MGQRKAPISRSSKPNLLCHHKICVTYAGIATGLPTICWELSFLYSTDQLHVVWARIHLGYGVFLFDVGFCAGLPGLYRSTVAISYINDMRSMEDSCMGNSNRAIFVSQYVWFALFGEAASHSLYTVVGYKMVVNCIVCWWHERI